MKIGIVTHPIEANYGGILQAAALQKVLRNLGHEPVTLRYSAPTTFERAGGMRGLLGKLSFLQLRKWLLVARDHGLLPAWVARALKWKGLENRLRSMRLRKFVGGNIKLSHRCNHPITPGDVERIGAERYIVGSDQVWRYAHIPYKQMFFLSFLPREIRRKSFTYAASFGVDQWEMPEELTRECSRLAQDLRAVSVREESGIALCREHLHTAAVRMPDPTMLLTAEDYAEMSGGISEPPMEGARYIACYILDPTPAKARYMEELSSQTGLPCIDIARMEEGGEQRSVEDWLRLIRHADYMLTDSFHGTVFSLVFGVSFTTFDNPERGSSRFASLLGEFGMEDRLAASDAEVACLMIDRARWCVIEDRMEKLRQKGLQFLRENLA